MNVFLVSSHDQECFVGMGFVNKTTLIDGQDFGIATELMDSNGMIESFKAPVTIHEVGLPEVEMLDL